MGIATTRVPAAEAGSWKANNPEPEPVVMAASIEDAPAAPIAPRRFTTDDTIAALQGAPALAWTIIDCESHYNPYALNPQSHATGPAQLLPGNGSGLEIFHRWGYDDPNNPYEAVAFVVDVINGRDGISVRSQYAATMGGCSWHR